MLPVSGAEQFITSDPMCPAWASISAMTPYCGKNESTEGTMHCLHTSTFDKGTPNSG